MSVFVCSDLHFNHKGILSMGRGFSTIEEHNEFIINQFNSVVSPDDTCYILGDIGFIPYKNLVPLVKRLNGHKILIFGNHDRFTDEEAKQMGFEEISHHPIYYSSQIILSHFPVKECIDNPYCINIHGHLHNAVLNLPGFFNVNIERYNYKPQNILQFETYARNFCKDRQERFGQEWYFDKYIWDPGKSANFYKKS